MSAIDMRLVEGHWVRAEPFEEWRRAYDEATALHRKKFNRWIIAYAVTIVARSSCQVVAACLASVGILGDAALLFLLGSAIAYLLPPEPKWTCPQQCRRAQSSEGAP